jgi:hypothetical protein
MDNSASGNDADDSAEEDNVDLKKKISPSPQVAENPCEQQSAMMRNKNKRRVSGGSAVVSGSETKRLRNLANLEAVGASLAQKDLEETIIEVQLLKATNAQIVCRVRDLTLELEKLRMSAKEDLLQLQTRFEKARESEISQLQTRYEEDFTNYLVSNEVSLKDAIYRLIGLRNPPRTRRQTKDVQLADAVFNGGLATAMVLEQAEKHVRACNPLESAEAVLRAMDLHGGVLNYGGLKLLRHVATPVSSGKSSFLVSQRQLTKMQHQVEVAAHQHIPFEMISEEQGIDGVKMNYEKLLAFSLHLYGLYDISQCEGL